MSLHDVKECLVRGGAPADWPQGWKFPAFEAWPPGWPKFVSDDVTLSAVLVGEKLIVRCLDEFGEDTDKLAGQCLEVRAVQGSQTIRVRQYSEAPWSKRAILKIEKLDDGGFGIEQPLKLERERMIGGIVVVKVKVYGMDGAEVEA